MTCRDLRNGPQRTPWMRVGACGRAGRAGKVSRKCRASARRRQRARLRRRPVAPSLGGPWPPEAAAKDGEARRRRVRPARAQEGEEDGGGECALREAEHAVEGRVLPRRGVPSLVQRMQVEANSRSRREASKPTAPCHTLSSSVSTGSSSGEKGGAVVCGSDMRSRLPKPTTFPALVWSPAIQATPSSTRGLPVESAAVGARGATILSAKPWSRIASLSASSGSTSAAQPNEPG
mmetsp:Transcript_33168/g.106662  ORF Transcript_33168/g.106662 Transcript_33168/m.106662 type:complete len:234 (-) Transcript_33168:85-786(-)